MFFPGTVSSELTGETRVIPRFDSTEENIRVLVEELILGPTSIYNSPFLSESTELQVFMVRDGVVYIDLSAGMLFSGSDVHLSVRESLSALRRNISFNFPNVRDIVITINGHLPFEPAFSGAGPTGA